METLAATLPKLVSSLVLAVRGELVPLLLYTISKHKVRLILLRLVSSLVLVADRCVSFNRLVGGGWGCRGGVLQYCHPVLWNRSRKFWSSGFVPRSNIKCNTKVKKYKNSAASSIEKARFC